MSVDLVIPSMGESVKSAIISRWLKKPGDSVRLDEALVEVDSDKATAELPSPVAGVVEALLVADGDEVAIGQVIARIAAGVAVVAAPAVAAAGPAGPAVRQALRDAGVDAADVQGSGKGGRITRADVEAPRAAAVAPVAANLPVAANPRVAANAPVWVGDEPVEIVPMTNLRRRIAERLVEAQATAAILTTFNEVDMSAIMALRNTYKDAFEKTHGVKMGFMGFFVRACIHALKAVPEVNAEIDGQDLIYKNHYDIGVAVGTDRGLVVPVVRDADALSLAGVEKAIGALGKKARDGALALDDLQGGTFTISNGGVYGSLMSTPILNAPQSGILGMHKIQERPVAVNGQVVIRPMMYLALSYDHRVVDGQGAVTFLVRVKEAIEDPQRLLLDI